MKRSLKLSTPKEVRAALAKIVNEVRAGDLSPQVGNCLIVGCNAILGALRADVMDLKLMELEEAVEAMKENRQ